MDPLGWEKTTPTDETPTFVFGSGVHAEIWPGNKNDGRVFNVE